MFQGVDPKGLGVEISCPTLLKWSVEGFRLWLLRTLSHSLGQSHSRVPIAMPSRIIIGLAYLWGAGVGGSPPGSPLAGSPVTRNQMHAEGCVLLCQHLATPLEDAVEGDDGLCRRRARRRDLNYLPPGRFGAIPSARSDEGRRPKFTVY